MTNIETLARDLARPGTAAIPYTDILNAACPLTLQTYRPAAYTPGRPVVLVQHGVLRNGDDYRDFWIPAAERHNLLIVALTFPDAMWPGVQSYNNGRVVDEVGVVRSAHAWSYAIVERVFADLLESGIADAEQAYLFGHSAGGQFVHRLMSSQSHTPFKAVAAGNAGWYTLPTFAHAFPEGLAGVGLTEAHLRRLLAYPLLLLAGDQDTVTNGEHLPSEPAAVRQGPHRYARAHNYFDAGKREAERLGVPFGWTLQSVPGIGHDGKAMSAVCAGLWFDGGMPGADVMARLAGSHAA